MNSTSYRRSSLSIEASAFCGVRAICTSCIQNCYARRSVRTNTQTAPQEASGYSERAKCHPQKTVGPDGERISSAFERAVFDRGRDGPIVIEFPRLRFVEQVVHRV